MSEEETKPAEQTWPVTFSLKTPIKFGDEMVTSLTFREGELRDLKGIKVNGDGLAMEHLILVAARMCGQPVAVIERLKGSDGSKAMGFARDFFVESLAAGLVTT